MTRKKVKLEYITNDAARKATFKKRKKGLMKKVRELSILCGIDACAIMYSPYDQQPEVWPSAEGVQLVFSRFRQMSDMDKSRKMVNQESFLRQRIEKAQHQLKREHRDNREQEMTQVMFQSLVGHQGLPNLSLVDISDVGWLVDKHLKEIEERMKSLRQKAAARDSQSSSALSEHSGVSRSGEISVGEGAANANASEIPIDPMQNQPWYVNMLLKPNENIGANTGRVEEMPPPQVSNTNAWWPDFLLP